MSREDEIRQGLRDPGGALIGGLYVEDYVQGIEDWEADRPPPKFTSTSYDLGRARAREKAEATTDVLAAHEREMEARHQRVREMLAGHPDVLADYDAKMAELRGPA